MLESEITTPSCKACAKAPAIEFTEQYFDKVRLLLRPSELEEFQLGGDDETHSASEILAHYQFEGEPAMCSFPEHARHGRGCVIRTACRRFTANIGRNCGLKTIANYAYLEAGLKRAETREKDRRSLRSSPAQELVRIAEWSQEVQRLGQVHRTMRRLLPAVFQTLQEHGPGKETVRVPVKRKNVDGNEFWDEVPQRLTGTELGNAVFGQNVLESAKRALEEVAKLVAGDPELRKPGPLHQRMVNARKEVTSMVNLCTRAREFFIDQNLELLLLASRLADRRTDGVIVRDRELRFFADGATRALGVQGYRVV